MTHFEVICPVCVGGAARPRCPLECTGGVQPRVTKASVLLKYFRMTCINCFEAYRAYEDCDYAFDDYNINGDCLVEK